MKNYLILGCWLSGKNQLINKLLSGKEHQSTHYLRSSFWKKAPVSVTEYFSCDVHIIKKNFLRFRNFMIKMVFK
ncbi:hypothetical protein [Treponema sp.]|uniref:hypothetical protein n=1 Tax=Treponema sp. TaxID=166 RepID=UPI003FD7D6FA